MVFVESPHDFTFIQMKVRCHRIFKHFGKHIKGKEHGRSIFEIHEINELYILSTRTWAYFGNLYNIELFDIPIEYKTI